MVGRLFYPHHQLVILAYLTTYLQSMQDKGWRMKDKGWRINI
jgi:hypothetical protein